jgi:type VI secretion system protein VasD
MTVTHRLATICLLSIFIGLGGCAGLSAVQLAGSAVTLALEATGVMKKDSGDPKTKITDLKISIFAGDRLNTTESEKPLSLVTKIYILRATDAFKIMSYNQGSSSEGEKAALADDLISVKEITLLPGKVFETTLKVPGDATAIGVIGLFRSPFGNRWKLAFDAKQSFESGITIGAHGCAFTVTKGAPILSITPESTKTLSGVQCNR